MVHKTSELQKKGPDHSPLHPHHHISQTGLQTMSWKHSITLALLILTISLGNYSSFTTSILKQGRQQCTEV